MKNNKGFISTVALYSTLLMVLFLIFYIMYFLSMGKATSDYITLKATQNLPVPKPIVEKNVLVNFYSNVDEVKNINNNFTSDSGINYTVIGHELTASENKIGKDFEYKRLTSYDSDDGAFAGRGNVFNYLGTINKHTILYLKWKDPGVIDSVNNEQSYYQLHKYDIKNETTIREINDVYLNTTYSNPGHVIKKLNLNKETTYYVIKRGYHDNDKGINSNDTIFYSYMDEDDFIKTSNRGYLGECDSNEGKVRCPSGSSNSWRKYDDMTSASFKDYIGKYIEKVDDNILESISNNYCNVTYPERQSYKVDECRYKLIYEKDSNETDVFEGKDGKKAILIRIITRLKVKNSYGGQEKAITYTDSVLAYYKEQDGISVSTTTLTNPDDSVDEREFNDNNKYYVTYLNIENGKAYDFSGIMMPNEYDSDHILIYTNTNNPDIIAKIKETYGDIEVITIDDTDEKGLENAAAAAQKYISNNN